MLLIPNGKGLLSSSQRAGPRCRTKSLFHLDDAESQNGLSLGRRQQIAQSSGHIDTHPYRALEYLRLIRTEQTGRYNSTLKLKHVAIYLSDSSHRLPPPLPPLFGGGVF